MTQHSGGCDCAEHRKALVEALELSPLNRRQLLRGAVGVGTVAALAGAVPSWASQARTTSGRTWMAGDLHVHTVLSHDVWGGLNDDNTSTAEFYTWGWSPKEQITLAELRGLNFLALTDHNRTDALFLPEYASSKLTLLPGYEHSLAGGHSGVFVPDRESLRKVLKNSKGSTDFSGAAGIREFINRVHDLDGICVLNHPFYKRGGVGKPPTWTYSTTSSMGVDAVEVWNSLWTNRSELTPSIAYDDPAALPWWESKFLPHRRMPMVGGSDNHWRILTAIAGVGQPTTWVHSDGPATHQILAAIRAGRTTVSAQPPAMGGARLEPMAFETWGSARTAGLGESVAAHGEITTKVRVLNAPGSTLRLISSGEVISSSQVTHLDETVVDSVVLHQNGWVRWELEAITPGIGMLAMTGPIYAQGLAPKSKSQEPSRGTPVSYPLP